MQTIPLPNGAKLALATTIGAAKVVSAITNANPAVATSTAHGLTAGKIIVFNTPGWPRLDSSVRRVVAPILADTFSIEGLDTTSTTLFPAAAGAGSVQEITAWTQIPKIASFSTDGGDPKTTSVGYLDYEKDINYITGENPTDLSFTISYAPDGAAFAALKAASDSGTIQIVRLTMKDGSMLFYSGQLHFNPKPVTTRDQEMVNTVRLALQGEFTRYAA